MRLITRGINTCWVKHTEERPCVSAECSLAAQLFKSLPHDAVRTLQGLFYVGALFHVRKNIHIYNEVSLVKGLDSHFSSKSKNIFYRLKWRADKKSIVLTVRIQIFRLVGLSTWNKNCYQVQCLISQHTKALAITWSWLVIAINSSSITVISCENIYTIAPIGGCRCTVCCVPILHFKTIIWRWW